MKKILGLGLIAVTASLVVGCKDIMFTEDMRFDNDQVVAFGLYTMSNQINENSVTTLRGDRHDTEFETNLDKLQPFYEMYEAFLDKSNGLLEGIEREEDPSFGINEEYDRYYKFTVNEVTYYAMFNVGTFESEEQENVSGKLIVQDKEYTLGGHVLEQNKKTNIKLIAKDAFDNIIIFSIHKEESRVLYRFDSKIDGVRSISHTKVGVQRGKYIIEVLIGEDHRTADYFRFTEKTVQAGKKITKMNYRSNGETGNVIIIEDIETGEIKFKILEGNKAIKEVISKVKHRFEKKEKMAI